MTFRESMHKEVSEIVTVSLFFLVSFFSIGVMEMLYLEEYGVSVFSVAKTFVSALVVAKVVLLLDRTSFGSRFRHHALWMDVLYKALVYTVCCAAVLSLERVFHQLSQAGTWMKAVGLALGSADIHRFFATVFCLFLVFTLYSLLRALSEHFGRGLMLSFIFSAEARRESRESRESLATLRK